MYSSFGGNVSFATCEKGRGAYHVEGNDIFEADFAGFVLFDEDLVNKNWAGAGGKAEDKRVCGCWCEGFDSVLGRVRDGGEVRGGNTN